MDLLDATALLLVLAACFGFINYHLFRLPFTIGLLLGGLLGSFGVLALEELIPGWAVAQHLRTAAALGDLPKRPEVDVKGFGEIATYAVAH